MLSVRRHLGLAVVAAGLVLGSSAALAASAENGQKAFMKYGCWQCHGTVGQGSSVTGPKLAPDPMPYEAMANFIRGGTIRMPPYREQVLPNEDLQDIHAYLSSVPKPVDYKTIEILKD
jgi:ubiquinol-cytochrome c reductase cytochrome c subunit